LAKDSDGYVIYRNHQCYEPNYKYKAIFLICIGVHKIVPVWWNLSDYQHGIFLVFWRKKRGYI